MIDLSTLATEQRNQRTMNLDSMSTIEALTIMNEEDSKVPEAVKQALPQIDQAVQRLVKALRNGGRLIYIGAGTSGRLGLLDAAECPPTFGTPPQQVVALLAGGETAFTQAAEGIEDSAEAAVADLQRINLAARDMVIGIAASGRTPYALGGLKYAREMGCATAAISCNHDAELSTAAEIGIEVVPGPEVLTGSTRLKAGTAQKLVLNMISTVAMVGIGKVYSNLMVDVRLTNKKLESRGINIIMAATDTDQQTAAQYLTLAEGSVKLAITMILLNCDAQTARQKLADAQGHISNAVQQ